MLAMLTVLLVAVASLVCSFLRERGDHAPPRGKEHVRKVAPDRLHVAFLWLPAREGMGATYSQQYQVWIEQLHGSREKRIVLSADKTNWIGISWATSSQLHVCYMGAQISAFRNHFTVVVRSGDVTILDDLEVVLRKVISEAEC